MKTKKILAMVMALVICMSSFAACNKKSDSSSDTSTVSVTNSAVEVSEADTDDSYNESEACKITLNKTSADIDGDGAEFKDGVLTISKGGQYVISGELTGRIVVDAGKKDEVKLVLNGVNITCEDNSAIQILKAKKSYVTLVKGTENTLTDGEKYSDDTSDAALYSKCDLTLNGEGKLTVKGNYAHGIAGKDDLIITGGEYNVTSVKTGIVGKDGLTVTAGTFDITAGTNGIKSNNSESGKGTISIEGGTFKITSDGDGIQATGDLNISGGTFDITTGGGSANASAHNGQDKFGGGMDGRFDRDKGRFENNSTDNSDNANNGGTDGQQMTPPDGNMPSDGNMPQMPSDGNMPDGQTPPDMPNGDNNNANSDSTKTEDKTSDSTADKANEDKTTDSKDEKTADNNTDKNANANASTNNNSSSDDSSEKALKADGAMNISGGEITIDSSDDSLHAAGTITITGGKITAASGDDGIHSDTSVVIEDGEINITKSYEGIEGKTIDINGGTITVEASDDGINSADPNQESQMNNAQDGVYLKINGGTVTVSADGDGLDSNGDIYITGGTTIVYGPTNNGDGALDCDGKITTSGGTLIAVGSSGMAETFDESSDQYSFLHNFDSTVSGGEKLTITDESGNVLFECTPTKQWQSVVFTSADLADGKTYTIKSGSTSETVTLSGKSTSNGTGGMGGFGGRGQMNNRDTQNNNNATTNA